MCFSEAFQLQCGNINERQKQLITLDLNYSVGSAFSRAWSWTAIRIYSFSQEMSFQIWNCTYKADLSKSVLTEIFSTSTSLNPCNMLKLQLRGSTTVSKELLLLLLW